MTNSAPSKLKECYVMFHTSLFRDGILVRAILRWERSVEWWMALCCMARENNRKGIIGTREDVVLLHRNEIANDFLDFCLEKNWLVEESGVLRLVDPDRWYRARARDPLTQNEQKQKQRDEQKSATKKKKPKPTRKEEPEAIDTGSCPQDVRDMSASCPQKKHPKQSKAKPSKSNQTKSNQIQSNQSQGPLPPETGGNAGGAPAMLVADFFEVGFSVYRQLESEEPKDHHKRQLADIRERHWEIPLGTIAEAIKQCGFNAQLKARDSPWGLFLKTIDEFVEQAHQKASTKEVEDRYYQRMAALSQDEED